MELKKKEEDGLLKELINDYDYYCRSNPLNCYSCNSASAIRLIEVKLNKQIITFHFQCEFCADKSFRSLRYQQLEYLALRFIYKNFPDNKNQDLYSYFRMFRLLYLYNHLMKGEKQLKLYEYWYKRLETSLNNKSKIEKAKEYHNNGHS